MATAKDGRDITKYSFDGGKPLPANNLVWTIVNDYVDKHPSITFAELERVFPKELQGRNFGVVKKYTELTEGELGHTRQDGVARFFIKPEQLIFLKEENIKVAVCTEWGKTGNNTNFLDFWKRMEELAYGDRVKEV